MGGGEEQSSAENPGNCGARVEAGRGVPGQEEVSGTRGSWPERCWMRQARLSPLLTPSPDPWEGGRTGGGVDRAPFLLRRMKGEAGYRLVLVAYWLPVITALGLSFLSLCQGPDPMELVHTRHKTVLLIWTPGQALGPLPPLRASGHRLQGGAVLE